MSPPTCRQKQNGWQLNFFSKTTINHNPKHLQPFSCPTYGLDSKLQAKQLFAKWKSQAKIGLYLGPSPQHARNVELVLHLQTRLVSSQFHVAHDPSFITVCNDTTKYHWNVKAGLTQATLFSQHNTKRVKSKTSEPQRRSKHCIAKNI